MKGRNRNITKSSSTFVLYFACIALCYPVLAKEILKIEVASPKRGIEGDANFNSSVSPKTPPIDLYKQPVSEANHLKRSNGRLVNTTAGPLKVNVSDAAQVHVKLYCEFEVYNKPTEVLWYKKDTEEKTLEPQLRDANLVGLNRINSTYDLYITEDMNGTYVCEINDTVTNKVIRGTIDVIVYAPPKIVGFDVTAINTTQLYINWTVRDYNSPIEFYALLYRALPSEKYNVYSQKISPKNTSFVINDLNKSTEYELKFEVKTVHWFKKGVWNIVTVKTLDKEPVFVPSIFIKGLSATSVTIGLAPPPEDLADLIHYYVLKARKKDDNNSSRETLYWRDGKNLPYMFDNLDPHSTYVFQVCACSDYSKQCGQWSDKMEVATLDGIPRKPSKVTIDCSDGFMKLAIDPPEKPNAEVKGYSVCAYSKQCGQWSDKMEAATLDGIPGKPSKVTIDCSSGFVKLTIDPPEKPNAEFKGYSVS